LIARLAEATLDGLPAWVSRPAYDRRELVPGVVHIGLGAFHRAHQAPLYDELAARGDMTWGVRAASLRSPSVRDALAPQDSYYCHEVRDQDRAHVRLIGSVLDVIVARERPTALMAALAAPTTHIVTLTVTEKGYLPDDRDAPGQPHSAAAYVAQALAVRRSRGLQPFTVISCDNLPNNGNLLRDSICRVSDEHTRDWIHRHGAFPRTMVDRIVPQTRPQDIDELASRIGLIDRAMVKTEPYWQWVIEDSFAGPRPHFEQVGVQIVKDVTSWEEAKLRLLNGAHSAMAYLGSLMGLETVDEFVAAPCGRAMVKRLWDEVTPTLKTTDALSLSAYQTALMDRFENGALGHRLRQIAADGSQKLPGRLVAPLADCLAGGMPCDALVLAITAWMRWQDGRTDSRERFLVDDPLAPRIGVLLAGLVSPAGKVRALLSVREIFPANLAADDRFVGLLLRQYDELQGTGAAAALERLSKGANA
jgi:fructuronate reductase